MSAWAPARASLRPRYRRKLPLSSGATYVDDLVLGLCSSDSAFGRPGSKKYCCRYSTMPWYKFTRSRGTPPALISTLDPALLRPSDHLDFSHPEKVIIRFPRSQQRTYALFRYCSLDHRQTAPFPAGCAWFLYYRTPQDKDRPPLGLGLEGSVRLRLTSDPSSRTHPECTTALARTLVSRFYIPLASSRFASILSRLRSYLFVLLLL
ncbi:hypothetical protein DFH08DRAFT_971217 [Mycena albidolilacea]|uniref:Uncharacterized protein n=1 Tax=Mycena albidolilacea TaxID=1033008 RepID=A0AAD7EGG4_9AGAR|nr:hypothetical protein DFH08DRAFT_971217 [Mycena albidolilacea]